MRPTADPRQQMRRQVLLVGIGVAVAIGAATVAARIDPPGPPHGEATPAASMVTATKAPARTTAAAWTVALWQPLSDVPVATAAPPPPIKLYCIMRRGDGYVAGIEAGDGGALTYVKGGDVVKGVTITAIDAQGLTLSVTGRPQRLELGQ